MFNHSGGWPFHLGAIEQVTQFFTKWDNKQGHGDVHPYSSDIQYIHAVFTVHTCSFCPATTWHESLSLLQGLRFIPDNYQSTVPCSSRNSPTHWSQAIENKLACRGEAGELCAEAHARPLLQNGNPYVRMWEVVFDRPRSWRLILVCTAFNWPQEPGSLDKSHFAW